MSKIKATYLEKPGISSNCKFKDARPRSAVVVTDF